MKSNAFTTMPVGSKLAETTLSTETRQQLGQLVAANTVQP
jgi:hypothetical protein